MSILVGTEVGGLVAGDGGTELVVVAGEDGVEQDTRERGNGKTGECDDGARDGEGDAADGAEAQTADKGFRRRF